MQTRIVVSPVLTHKGSTVSIFVAFIIGTSCFGRVYLGMYMDHSIRFWIRSSFGQIVFELIRFISIDFGFGPDHFQFELTLSYSMFSLIRLFRQEK